MDVLLWLLFGVLPAIAAMLLGVGAAGPRWLAPALAVAICVPFAMAHGVPDWFWRLDLLHGAPRPALWWLLLFAGLFGAVHDRRWLPMWCLLVPELMLVALQPWLLSSELRDRCTFEACSLYLISGWLVALAAWWGLRRAAQAHPGLLVPLAMTVVLAVDAWMLARNTGGADWQLAGVAAIALAFAVLTTTWRRPFECGVGGALCMTIAHTGLLLCGRSERELWRLSFLMAWLSPLPIWLAAAPRFRRRRRSAAALGLAGVVAAAATAVWAC